MQFLVPIFWIASITLAVPILLHLTRKNVRRPTLFPSLMFLQKIRVHELNRRRIQKLPLLLLRCLAILLLVAAFAQPVLKSRWLGKVSYNEGRSIVLLVDNSLSASREKVWKQVVESALEEIEALAEGDEASIVQFGETAEVVWSWDRRRQALVTAAHKYLRPSFSGTAYHAGLRRAAELLGEASHPRKEICLITDMQASGLGGQKRNGLVIPSLTHFKVKEVGADASNSYVDQVRLIREVYESGYPYSIQVQVVSIPPIEGRRNVTLYVGGEVVDRRVCELGSDGLGTVQFEPFALSPGISRGRILLDSDDAIVADDGFHFVLERRAPFVVTLLRKEGIVPPFFEEALSSGRNLPFRVKSVSGISNLSLPDSPVLVFDNVPAPPAADLLRPYLEQGGGLIVCPGEDVNASEYNRRLQQVLPVVLKNREFAHGRNIPFLKIDSANWEHPVFSGAGNGLAEVQFYGYWALEPVREGQVLARFNTGAPVLVEASIGSGKVLVFASSLGRVWSDFPLSNAYLPFWQMMVQYAVGLSRQPAALIVDQVLGREYGLHEHQPERSGAWEILDPKGQRLFSLDDKSPESVQLRIPGYYEIRRDRKTEWVAVNTDRKESDLSRLDSGEMMALLEASRNEGPVRQEIGSDENPQQSLWGLLLIMALLILILESILANGPTGRSRMVT